MTRNKTKPTGASIADHIARRANEEQAADCKRLMAIMKRVTRKQPKMWGPSIVGYGSYRYTYNSGHSGEMPLAGFAIRGRELVVYIYMDSASQKSLLSKLGRYRNGKVCLYIKRLDDIDTSVLRKLIAASVAEVRRRYG